ncbi:hypothetical protein ES731_08300 [Psychroflexus gondwanensis]|nr:hypothetical protein ES731_08300 [Psychroflexus gondwanensis]
MTFLNLASIHPAKKAGHSATTTPLTTHNSPLTTHHSRLTTHDSRLTTHNSPPTTTPLHRSASHKNQCPH